MAPRLGSCLAALGLSAVVAATPAVATAVALDQEAALAASQAALGRQLGGYRLRDAENRSFTLDELRGRPLVVQLVYTSCQHSCPVTSETLARAVDVAAEALGGNSFAVLTVGFDTRVDTSDRMRIYGRRHGLEAASWRLASADPVTLAGLAEALGFSFVRSAKGYDHLTQVSVLDAEGRVYRQVYGETFAPPALVEPLKQLVFGRRADPTTLAGWINGVRLICTIYDPSSERYRFDYSLFVGIAVGFVSLGAVALFLLRAWFQPRPGGTQRQG